MFIDGVLVAKKDFHPTTKHDEIDVLNLYVVKMMQSLKSRNYVTETFNWQFYYFYLTNEGIEYLRDYLHLPEEIVPATLKKPRTTTQRTPTGAPPRQERGAGRGGRPDAEKKVGAPSADFKPDFVSINYYFNLSKRGGYGRGGPRRDSGREYRRDQAPPPGGRGAPRQQ